MGWNTPPEGRALVAEVGPNEFLVTGYKCKVNFFPGGNADQRKGQLIEHGTELAASSLIDGKWVHMIYVHVERGTEENGKFVFRRILDGSNLNDGIVFGETPMVLRVLLTTY